MQSIDVEAAWTALAEPTRREILRVLARDELRAGDIAARFPHSRPAISKHLRVLREAGLVAERRAGTQRIYRVRPEGLDALRDQLESFWDDGLRDIKARAEAIARKREMSDGS